MTSISIGSRLGPYEVISPLGAGGMGEVFRARDTRLDRSVAIKVLPAELAQNAQLRLRFEREARLISQLSHPNICTLYDVGDGYLVMELLEGETLADRIVKGPLPLDELIRIGTQIASALERAHKAGIVHRDLKPGNVMLTKSGAKLLDFGLAIDRQPIVVPQSSVLVTENKPLTAEGTLIGTVQYMAPEQLEGGTADARTDIFAFGAVLYEMATGRRAFEGKSQASVIASILAAEPKPVSATQPMSPPALDRLISTCLAKDPERRWQSAHDIGTQLLWIGESSVPAPRGTSKRGAAGWIVAALLAITTIAGGTMVWRKTAAERYLPAVRTTVLPPDKTAFDFLAFGAPPAISPDGTRIVFGAAEPGKPRSLWVRSLDSFSPQQLGGTEGATFPFWSPDGRFIAFFADNSLKKIEVGGGAPVVLCSVVDGRGGSWSPNGETIIFAGRYSPIYRVSSSGGSPVEVTKMDSRWGTHRWPEFLPDGRHFLYLASPSGVEDPSNTIFAGSIDGQVQKGLITAANEPHYFDGTLIFTRDRILMAQPFDAKRLALTGDALPLKEQQIESTPLMSRSIVSISAAGTLVYQTGVSTRLVQLQWFDRSGKPIGLLSTAGPYTGVTISPDEKSVLTGMTAGGRSNIWSFDLLRGTRTRLTFNDGIDVNAIWSPDGRKIIYTSFDNGKFRLVLRDLTTGSEERLLDAITSAGVPAATSWSLDGQRILYSVGGRTSRADLWWMSLADRKTHPYLITPFVEGVARLSPDGKWVVYQSNESGQIEVYLAPFPWTGAKWQVSTGGGMSPRWRADGKEIFYLGTQSTAGVFALPVTLGPMPELGQAVKLFDFHVVQIGPNVYDVSRDGNRFLVNTRVGEEPPPAPLLVVQHLDRELRAELEHAR